jgi:hypothetical protein
MDLHVSNEARRATKYCAQGFSCLDKNRKDLCAVEENILGIVFRIKCLNTEVCSYQYSLSDGCFCACPVRKEIFNEYRI